MFFATAASYWATYPISTCLRPRSVKLARSASIPCLSTRRFMKLNRQQTAMAECKAASFHPAAKTASASACVMRVGVSVRLLHESEDRPQLAVNGSGGEVLDQAIYRFRRDAEQLRRRAVASVAVLARVEGRHVCADQLPLGWRKRRRATQDRLGNADPMRVDLGMGGKNVLGCRI